MSQILSWKNKPWIRLTLRGLYCLLLIVEVSHFLLQNGVNFTADARAFFTPWVGRLQKGFTLLCLALTAAELLYSWPRAVFCALLLALRWHGPTLWQSDMLIEMLLLASLSNLGTKRTIACTWLGLHLVFFAFLGLLLHQGWAANIVINKGIAKGLLFPSSHSLGMPNSNNTAIMLMSTWMMVWGLFLPKKWWITLPFFWAGAVGIYGITLSRSVLVALALFPVMELVCRAIANSKHSRWLSLTAAVPMLCMIATLILGYITSMRWESVSHNTFWQRFYPYVAMRNDGLSLLGRIPSFTGYADNFYLCLLMFCGLFLTAAVMALTTLMNLHLARRRQIWLLSSSVMLLIYAMMESSPSYPVYGFVPLLAFAPGKLSFLRKARQEAVEPAANS